MNNRGKNQKLALEKTSHNKSFEKFAVRHSY